jgi:hypothetical protein
MSEIVANWAVAVGTLVIAAVAVFQEPIRGRFYRPKFQMSIKTGQPDCVMLPYEAPDGTIVTAVYLRLWVKNVGCATAKNAEVYARELRRQRADGEWEPVQTFPPMNLKWAYLPTIYFPSIAPGMGKHCDIAHIIEPMRRYLIPYEDAPNLGLTDQQTSLAFDLMAAPSDKGHIVRFGEYQLDILVAAENARPITRTLAISLPVPGSWYADVETMLRDGVGVKMAPVESRARLRRWFRRRSGQGS